MGEIRIHKRYGVLLVLVSIVSVLLLSACFGPEPLSETEIRQTVEAEIVQTEAAVPTDPPEPTADPAAQPTTSTVSEEGAAALTATSNSPLDVRSGPAVNCDIIANWPATQSGTLLTRINNPDGSVYYKALAPNTTVVGYVFAGQNNANFSIQGDANTLPVETVSGCASTDRPALDAPGPSLSASPTAPAVAPVDCGQYGDGGVIFSDDTQSCTYSDVLFDLCGNSQVMTGPLDPAACEGEFCGTYGDAGCDEPVPWEGVCTDGLQTLATTCYDFCGNSELFIYNDVCLIEDEGVTDTTILPEDGTAQQCGLPDSNGCDAGVLIQACTGDVNSFAIFEVTCYDDCNNPSTFRYEEACFFGLE